VLGVVEEEQELLGRKSSGKCLQRVLVGIDPHLEGLRDRRQDERRVPKWRELDEHDTVRVGAGHLASDLERESRLSASAGAGQHDQARVAALEQRVQRLELAFASDEGVRWNRERDARLRINLDVELRVLLEDAALELAQRRARLETEFVVESRSERGVVLERVRLASAPVFVRVREHLSQHRRGATELELRREPLLDRDEPQLLEPLALAPREVVVRELPVRATAPQRQRAIGERERERRVARLTCRDRLAQKSFEAGGIQCIGRERCCVRARSGRDLEANRQHLAQLRDVDLHELARGSRRRSVPDRVDELVDTACTAVGDEQRGEQPCVLAGERDRAVLSDELDGAEHAHVRRSHWAHSGRSAQGLGRPRLYRD